MQAADRVRLKLNPTRVGVLTGQESTRRGRRLVQVQFPDGAELVADDELELMPAGPESPLDLLRAGRLGAASDLRRKLTHVRLTGRLADLIYSMEVTNTEFHAYQFKPVIKMLNSPTNGLLIADEVGLGKTIEAGLIWTELRSRFDLRRLLVVCPAALREKWVLELREKMGVEAAIVNAEALLAALRDPERARNGYALVCSVQGLRPNGDWEDEQQKDASSRLARHLRDSENEDRLVDLLVIDEAHHLRNPETRTNKLGELLRNVSEYLVLLSATPVHNRSDDLHSLLRLLDPQTFSSRFNFADILRANEPLVRARDLVFSDRRNAAGIRALLEQAARDPLLQGNRQLEVLLSQPIDEGSLASPSFRTNLAYRLETVNQLAHVVTRTRKRDVKEWRVVREPHAPAIEMNALERRFYDAVTEVVHTYAQKSATNALFLLATPQRQMTSCMAAALRGWRAKLEDLPEDVEDGDRDELIGPLIETLATRLREFDPDELERNDEKYRKFYDVLRDHLRKLPSEKIVVFSSFRGTLEYLHRRLKEAGLTSIVMMGGQVETKQEILEAYSDPKGPSILLSSEVGAEGIDLQFSSVMVNYDLPWNPMRLEQRIGRIDRHGQLSRVVHIINLLQKDTIDDRLYRRLYEKLDLCRRAIGDFEEILGDQVDQLTIELLKQTLSPKQQELQIEQTAQAVANLRREQEKLEEEAAHLIAYGDYILNQVQAAREMNRSINGPDLREYVLDFLKTKYTGCTFRQHAENELRWDIGLSPAAKHDLGQFISANDLGVHTRLVNTGAAVSVIFENRVAAPRQASLEPISQFHPLVRFVAKQQREMTEGLRPAVAIRVPKRALGDSPMPADVYVVALQLWSLSGVQSQERLVYAGYRFGQERVSIDDDDAERLALAAAAAGETWHSASSEVDLEEAYRIANDELFGAFDERFVNQLRELEAQNDDRASIQLKSIDRHFESSLAALEAVRTRHLTNGRNGLVVATEGRIAALRERVALQRLRIQERRKLVSSKVDVAVALIQFA